MSTIGREEKHIGRQWCHKNMWYALKFCCNFFKNRFSPCAVSIKTHQKEDKLLDSLLSGKREVLSFMWVSRCRLWFGRHSLYGLCVMWPWNVLKIKQSGNLSRCFTVAILTDCSWKMNIWKSKIFFTVSSVTWLMFFHLSERISSQRNRH